MIPDIAIIITAYAVARLVNAYILEAEELRSFRVSLAVVAIAVIGFSLADVITKSNEVGTLLP